MNNDFAEYLEQLRAQGINPTKETELETFIYKKKLANEQKEYCRQVMGPPPPQIGAFMSNTIDGNTAHGVSPNESNAIRNPSMIKVKVFEKKSYPNTENFEEDINDFMEYITRAGLQGSLTLFEGMVYVVYHKK